MQYQMYQIVISVYMTSLQIYKPESHRTKAFQVLSWLFLIGAFSGPIGTFSGPKSIFSVVWTIKYAQMAISLHLTSLETFEHKSYRKALPGLFLADPEKRVHLVGPGVHLVGT